MMGRAGKCPWNQGSPMVTHLWPTMRSPGTTSVTRSTSTNGQRCGRICRMRSISIEWCFTRLTRPRRDRRSRGRARRARAATARAARPGILPRRPPRGTSPMTPLLAAMRAPSPTVDVVGEAGLAADEHPASQRDRAREARTAPRGCVPSPTSPLWPTWTCASSFAPRRTRVGASVPASTVQSGPMTTSSSMTTPPSCGTARTAPAGPAPSRSPGARSTAPAPIVTRAPMTTRGPRTALGAMTQPAPDDRGRIRHLAQRRAAPPSPRSRARAPRRRGRRPERWSRATRPRGAPRRDAAASPRRPHAAPREHRREIARRPLARRARCAPAPRGRRRARARRAAPRARRATRRGVARRRPRSPCLGGGPGRRRRAGPRSCRARRRGRRARSRRAAVGDLDDAVGEIEVAAREGDRRAVDDEVVRRRCRRCA